MRVSQREKDRSGQRIVASAARLMRERGIDGATVGEVMNGAGMTLGGFYRHFDSKEALVSAAVQAAFDQMLAERESHLQAGDPKNIAADFQRDYLSDRHVADHAGGCPVAALAGELSRGAAPSTAPVTAGVNRMLDLVAAGLEGDPPQRRVEAARQLAAMVGAVLIARATDPDTAQLVLDATRSQLPSHDEDR